jgi:hypothetical protein
MRWAIVSLLFFGIAAFGPRAASQEKSPFTREVEEFVDICLKHGGDRLTLGEARQDLVPGRRVAHLKTIEGLTVALVASERVVRQPIGLRRTRAALGGQYQEHNNTQNNGNHLHAVWRDFNGDFGRARIRRTTAKSLIPGPLILDLDPALDPDLDRASASTPTIQLQLPRFLDAAD